jgi:hypothetical protein
MGRESVMEAIRRFEEQRRNASDVCPKSRNGRHHFVGYRRRACKWCGKGKDR